MPDNGNLTYLVRPSGKPYTPDTLGKKFKEWADAAALAPQCRLHGLRKGRARQIVDSGGTAHDIMSITGHKTLREAQRYADKYNRRSAADRATALLMRRGQKENVECKTA
jgi:integrase